MTIVRYRTPVRLRGKQTEIPFPYNPHELWGTKTRQDVCGTIAGKAVRGPLDSGADGWSFPLGPSFWRDTGIDPSTLPELDIHLGPEGPLVEEQPDDIRGAIDASPPARDFFYSIAPHYRKNWLRWVTDARRDETRKARIVQMVDALAAGQRDR